MILLAGVVVLNSGSTPDAATGESAPTTTAAPSPKDVATKYVLAFSSHDAATAAKYTDNPEAATAAITDVYSSVS